MSNSPPATVTYTADRSDEPAPTTADIRTIDRVIRRAARHDITLSVADFAIVPGWGPMLDSMDPDEWLADMLMD
ncbi:hypothetical protein [Gordonia crocea]|uniref:Uncharacterized protein n=1 Tax=Gordonia crocea TaxID=589162 RepID=A0A7M3SUS6_9ACTN|nr:hypothetical protein [Gordonia crocea]GED96400.1 hypothetical protein nbrc107697_04390 [Gordonia crocea]